MEKRVKLTTREAWERFIDWAAERNLPIDSEIDSEYLIGLKDRFVKEGKIQIPRRIVARLQSLMSSYFAEHWTEEENPAHEIMEAVCQIA